MRRVTAIMIALLLQAVFPSIGEATFDVYEVTSRNIKSQPLPLDVRASVRGIFHDFIVVATFDSRALADTGYVTRGSLEIPGLISTPVLSKREGDTLTWQFCVGERVLDRSVFTIGQGVKWMPGGTIWNVQLATFLPGQPTSSRTGKLVALPLVASTIIIAMLIVLRRWQKTRHGTDMRGAA